MCSIQTMVTPAGADAADGVDQLVALALGQAAGDLVEQQQTRLGGERARQLQALALEQRQRAGAAVGARQQAGALEHVGAEVDRRRARVAARRAPRRPAGSRTRSDSRTAAGSGRSARCRRGSAACGAGRVMSLPSRRICAGIGRELAGDQVEQRGLAGAVRADDAERLALARPQDRSRRRPSPSRRISTGVGSRGCSMRLKQRRAAGDAHGLDASRPRRIAI